VEVYLLVGGSGSVELGVGGGVASVTSRVAA
jgi:hypothetical protein